MNDFRVIFLTVLFATLVIAALVGLSLGRMPLAYTTSLAGFPSGALIAVAIFIGRGNHATLVAWSHRLFAGLVAGLAATAVYDGYRVAIRYVTSLEFDPFRVQPVFGQIITGLPSTHPIALVAGWGYHLWIGILLGMLLSVLRPTGGILAGAIFAGLLQLARWAMYPDVLRAGFSDPEFFANGVLGQLLWGMVAGFVLYRLNRYRLNSAP